MKLPSMPAMPSMKGMPSMKSMPSMPAVDFSTNVLFKVKTGLHTIQGLLTFIAWAILIAVLIGAGPTGGGSRWMFALCWLSIPVLIYQTAVPLFPKTRRFANAYAFAALDVVFTIFWLSAFAAVIAWNSAGMKAGADKKKLPSGNCTTFDYGSEKKCNLSKATAGIGGFIFMFFIFTSGLSIYGATYFKKHGSMPGAKSTSDPSSIEAQTRDAFSTGDHHDGAHIGGGIHEDDDEYALLHSNENNGGSHTGRPLSWGAEGAHENEDYDTPYHNEYADHHTQEAGDAGLNDPYHSDYAAPHPPEHGTDVEQPYSYGGSHTYAEGHEGAPPYHRSL